MFKTETHQGLQPMVLALEGNKSKLLSNSSEKNLNKNNGCTHAHTGRDRKNDKAYK